MNYPAASSGVSTAYKLFEGRAASCGELNPLPIKSLPVQSPLKFTLRSSPKFLRRLSERLCRSVRPAIVVIVPAEMRFTPRKYM